MKKQDLQRAKRIENGLTAYEEAVLALPGIANPITRRVLVRQMIDSERRVEFVRILRLRDPGPRCSDPLSANFDPLRGAAYQANQGNLEEASWLAFLSVYFGKHERGGWRYVRDVYGRLGSAVKWDWPSASANPNAIHQWLVQNAQQIHANGPGGFSNHRKYLSLYNAGAAIEAYISWVNSNGGHAKWYSTALTSASGDPGQAFDSLYRSVRRIGAHLGRLGAFDFLCMLRNLGLVQIAPSSPYLVGSTGPLNGARLLYGANEPALTLDARLSTLGHYLGTEMQALEDSLCNWHKDPNNYRRY